MYLEGPRKALLQSELLAEETCGTVFMDKRCRPFTSSTFCLHWQDFMRSQGGPALSPFLCRRIFVTERCSDAAAPGPSTEELPWSWGTAPGNGLTGMMSNFMPSWLSMLWMPSCFGAMHCCKVLHLGNRMPPPMLQSQLHSQKCCSGKCCTHICFRRSRCCMQ